MKHLTVKDKRRRLLFSWLEKRRIILKALAMDQRLPFVLRIKARVQLSSQKRNSSKTRFVSHCILTGRSRSVSRFCHLSRLKFREHARMGFLPGIRKSGW